MSELCQGVYVGLDRYGTDAFINSFRIAVYDCQADVLLLDVYKRQ